MKIIAAGLAAIVAACGSDEAGLAAGPDRVLDPSIPGPYAVGVTTVVVEDPSRPGPDDEGIRTLKIEIWYPATDDALELPRDVIDFREDAPPDLVAMLGDAEVPTFEQPAARDAAPRSDQGSYPVVLFSHGYAALRFQSFSLTTHLASHGYVVVAPDHEGNTFYDQSGLESSFDNLETHALNRLNDVPFLLDLLDARGLGDESLAAVIDPARVGLSGHSFGGFTSLVVGANGFFHDERVSVLAGISPAVRQMDMIGASVETIAAPTLYLGGTDDLNTPYEEDLVFGYEHHAPGPRGMVALEGAGHLSFIDLCDPAIAEIVLVLDFPDDMAAAFTEGCGPDYADPDWVHSETARWVTTWFNTYLRESDGTGAEYLDGAEPGDGVELRLDR